MMRGVAFMLGLVVGICACAIVLNLIARHVVFS
jgi:hypothetical protein